MKKIIILVALGLASINSLAFHRLAKPVVGGLAAVGTTYLATAKCELLEEDAKEKCMWFMNHPHFVKQARFNPDQLKDLQVEDAPALGLRAATDYLNATNGHEETTQLNAADFSKMYNCLFQESPVFKKLWDRPETATVHPALAHAYKSILVAELTGTSRIATAKELAVVRALTKEKAANNSQSMPVSAEELKMIKRRAGIIARLKSKAL